MQYLLADGSQTDQTVAIHVDTYQQYIIVSEYQESSATNKPREFNTNTPYYLIRVNKTKEDFTTTIIGSLDDNKALTEMNAYLKAWFMHLYDHNYVTIPDKNNDIWESYDYSNGDPIKTSWRFNKDEDKWTKINSFDNWIYKIYNKSMKTLYKNSNCEKPKIKAPTVAIILKLVNCSA